LTISQFEGEIQQHLARFVKDPRVVVTITEFNSQPISILGAVNNAGVKQIVGRKTLFEVLSLAGGLRPDAGSVIRITRYPSGEPMCESSGSSDTGAEFDYAAVLRAASH
jgi:polysaccharide export outer membrane protein